MSRPKIYLSIIEQLFRSKFKPGMRAVGFEREEIIKFGKALKVDLPKNLGDVVYTVRYRAVLPDTIQATAGEGEAWIIRPAGRSKYRFVLVPNAPLTPTPNMTATKVPMPHRGSSPSTPSMMNRPQAGR